MKRALAAALLACALAAAPARGAVEVLASLDRGRAQPGETVTLSVVVRGAFGGVGEPDLRLPRGLEILNTAQEQRASWVNGRSALEKEYRYELAVLEPGRYVIGPVRVSVGGQLLQSAAQSLLVPEDTGGSGAGRLATLVVDAEPREPWVGQPVLMRVRLVLAREPAMDPSVPKPPTPGFWAETAGPMTWSYGVREGRRFLVAGFGIVLLPLAPGMAHIGSTSLTVVFDERTGDPASPTRQRLVTVRSQPLDLRVRALPAGAPAGFDGAVGVFGARWTADRRATSQDVPVTVRLDVRGVGNLPLLKAPALACPDAEVFAAGSEDSLPGPGSLAAGRRSFEWNVLPRRPGRLQIPAPAFAWFDPRSGRYQALGQGASQVEVGPPVFSARDARAGFPGALADDVPDPFARGVAPWAWALAGLALGTAWVAWRTRPAADPAAAERARVAVWRNALKAPAGPAFWRAAEEVTGWLEARGRAVREVRALVEQTRYGGGGGNADAVRSRLAGELAAALPAARARRSGRPLAVLLALVAAAALALSGVVPAGGGGDMRMRAADQQAREGEVAAARSAWAGLWRAGARSPALAARLAWTELSAGHVAPAAVWVLRGERGDARDPALAWVAEALREAGGLAGDRGARVPVRRIEWAAAALLLGVAAGALWPRRLPAAAAALLCLACAGADPAQRWWLGRAERLVVAHSAPLQGAGLELEPGQVVRVMERDGRQLVVRAGRDVEGSLDSASVLRVGEGP